MRDRRILVGVRRRRHDAALVRWRWSRGRQRRKAGGEGIEQSLKIIQAVKELDAAHASEKTVDISKLHRVVQAAADVIEEKKYRLPLIDHWIVTHFGRADILSLSATAIIMDGHHRCQRRSSAVSI